VSAEKRGSLIVVGTGIQTPSQVTLEARAAIAAADSVFHVVTDAVAEEWIAKQNPSARSLRHLYRAGKQRWETYMDMAEAMLADVREGLDVCGVYYGHPGVFAVPTHRAIQAARREGYRARMLPGISALDCLFADLGVDPGMVGCQSFEATDLLISQRRFDTTSALVLWQIGAIGVQDYPVTDCNRPNLRVLAGYLLRFYTPEHPVIVYEAAWLPLFRPTICRLSLVELADADVTTLSTLFVPPAAQRPFDQAMLDALAISPDSVPNVGYAINTDSSAL
jgi:precorrin-3B methylase